MVESEFAPRAADHADTDEHRLLDDDHDDGRHDERSVTQIGVEEVVRLVDHGLGRGLRLRDVGPLGDQALEFDHRPRLADRGHDLLEHLPVHQEIAGVAVDRHIGLLAAVELLFVVRGDVDHAVDLAGVKQRPGLLHRGRRVGDVGVGPGVEGVDQTAAGRRAGFVHHADRHVAQHLRTVGQRIGRGVDDEREDQDQHGAAVLEDRLELVADDRPQLLPIGGHLVCESTHTITSPRIFPPCIPFSDAAGRGAVRQ